jgi:hypothetical protein
VAWKRAALFTVALAGVVLQGGAQTAIPPEVEAGQALLREGKAQEAWRLLSPLEKQYAGVPEFDLALAMAATDSGRPNRATFALERVLVTQPGNATARLELARAYYALRDHERAERELRLILQGNPPPEVRALIAQYRHSMRDMPAAALQLAAWSGYAEAGVGHDTNANIATAQGSIFVPSLGAPLILDRPFVRDPDDFAALAAGLEYVRPLGGGTAAILGADLQSRRYAELDRFDSLAVDFRASLSQSLGARDSMQYTLRHNDYELDHASYRRMQSAAVEWRRAFGERARLGLAAQGYRIRYREDDVKASSSDLAALAASAAYVFDGATRNFALASLYFGSDNATAGRADGDRRLLGSSMTWQRSLAPRLALQASLALLGSRYADVNPDFNLRRRDRQIDATLALVWRLADGWYLRPQLARTRNHSNIPLNEYARTEASLILRREWQ